MTHVRSKESKKQPLRAYIHLIYNIVNLSMMTGKTGPFSGRSVEDELVVQFLENLITEKICCYFKLR